MTDTLTVGDMTIPKAQIPAVAGQLRNAGHDKVAEELETAEAIGLKRMTVNSRELDAVQHALEAVAN